MGRRPRLDSRYCLDASQNQLIQTAEDKTYYDRLVSMVHTMHNGLSMSVTSKSNCDLWLWIIRKTPKLIDTDSFKYTVSTRIFWIRYGLSDFPRCKVCGKMIGFQHQVKLVKGYPEHCSLACAQHDPTVTQRKIDTNIELHGVKWWNNLDKTIETMLSTYGVDNYTKTPEYKVKQKAGFRRHYGVDHNMKCEEGRKEWSDSYKANTGYDHNWKNPECREVMKGTINDKYGVDHNMKCERGKEEWRDGIHNKYGNEYNHNWQVPSVREAGADTCEKLYGYRFPMQCPEIRHKAQMRYTYDNINFDSKPEIAFYVWLKDNDVQFEYQPDCDFWYEYEGKPRRYYPDFRVGDTYYEIKGDHMISESGEWICPWDTAKNNLYEVKHQYVLKIGVVVLTSKDYSRYLDYVAVKYGKDWLDGFKNDG